jgi:alkylation response protein AidB-like acyl-CoA dehydrogenase
VDGARHDEDEQVNFDLSEEQSALAELATRVFQGSVDVERVKAAEASDDRIDRALWADLAAADLLGVALPEAHGGLGFGILELCLVLEQQGRQVAPVPYVPTIVQGALPIARFGSPAQQEGWLPAVAAGDAILTGAYAQPGANDVLWSSVRAEQHGDSWILAGTKIAVPAAHIADAIVVPAETERGLTVFVVPTDADGIDMVWNETTAREIHCTVHLDDVEVDADDVIGAVGAGPDIVDWTVQRIDLANSALALGACTEALRMTAEYTSQREQFGRPLSTNQGVAMRAADAYIDIDCMRVTLWHAAWRLDQGLPAADEVHVAKYWAAEGGQRVVHATQHLHGGMGADVDYPVHRMFLWVKQLQNLYGSGPQHLAALGARIAASTNW